MPKSKHNRKGKNRGSDRRPVARSGKNEGEVDYRYARPTSGEQKPITGSRQCPYLDRIASLPDTFTKDECAKIIDDGVNNWIEKESQIQRDPDGKIEQNFVEDLDYRNTTLFIPQEPIEWLFSRVLGAIKAFNDSPQGYGFAITGLAEPPNLMRYHAPDIDKRGKPGKYDWHIDVGPGVVPSMRKLSYSILLNPGKYEGGDFVSKIGKGDVSFERGNLLPNSNVPAGPEGNFIPTERDLTGTMILFPSYLLHRIAEVSKGTRYSLVGWAHGNSFI